MSDAQMTAVDSLPKVLTDDQMTELPAQEPLTTEKPDQATIDRMRFVEKGVPFRPTDLGTVGTTAVKQLAETPVGIIKGGIAGAKAAIQKPKEIIPAMKEAYDYAISPEGQKDIVKAGYEDTKGLVLFLPQTLGKFIKNPQKQITEDPVGTIFLFSAIGGGAAKLASRKLRAKIPLAPEEIKALVNEIAPDRASIEATAERLRTLAETEVPGTVYGEGGAVIGQEVNAPRFRAYRGYKKPETKFGPPTEIPEMAEAARMEVPTNEPQGEVPALEVRIKRDVNTGETIIRIPREGRQHIAEQPNIISSQAGIPDVYMRMPMDALKQLADYGVEGARKAHVVRSKSIAEAPQTPVFQSAERSQAAPEPKTTEGGYTPTGKGVPAATFKSYEEAQLALDNKVEEFKKKGMTLDQAYETPEADAILKARDRIGQVELEKSHAELIARIEPIVGDRALSAAILKDIYNIDPADKLGQYFASEYASEFASGKMIDATASDIAKKIARDIVKKRFGDSVDFESVLNKNISGLTEYGIKEIVEEARSKAHDVSVSMYEYFNGDHPDLAHPSPKQLPAPQPKPTVEVLPEFTKEQAEARDAVKKAKRDAEYQSSLKAETIEREPKPEVPVREFAEAEKAVIVDGINKLTSGSRTPKAWRTSREFAEENRAELVKQALLKLPEATPEAIKKFVYGYAPHIKGGELMTREAQARAKTGPLVVKTPDGQIDISESISSADQVGAKSRPKGKNVDRIEDVLDREREQKLQDELADFAERIGDEYESRIVKPNEKKAFAQYKKLPSGISLKEQERLLKKSGTDLSDDTIGKLVKKWDVELGQKKKVVEDFLRQRDEAQDIIDREFIKPEGRVKSGGTLPPRPGEPTAIQPKYAGSANLERIDEGVEIKDIILKESERWGDFEKNRRMGMTLTEIGELADAIKKTPEEMARVIKSKTGGLPEALTHFRDILVTAASEAQKIAIENRTNPSVELEAKHAMALKRFEYILGTAESGQSEVARTMSAFRILSKAKEFEVVKNYKEILKRLGSQSKNADIMRMLSQLDPNDPMAVAKFLRGAIKATTKDKLFELWVNGLLSNPKTWIRNFVSNDITAPIMPLTRTIAGIADLRRGKAREISLMETPAMMQSIVPGIKDGVRRALFAWNNEMTMANLSKIETAHYGAIKGTLGKVVRTSGKMLMVGDEFFKGALRMADIYAMATRQAFKEGKKGEARLDRIAELIKNPTAEMEGHAVGEALYYTFQKELGKTGKELMALREKFPAFKFIAPFLRTPINIAKFGVEHTPLKFMDILYKVKTKGLKGTALSTELSKAGLGTLTTIAVTLSVLDGDITGSAPQDPEERAAFFRQGKKEYAVKAGNAWYSYGYLEPVGTSIGIVADFALTMDNASEQEKAKIAGKILTSFYKNLSSKTFNTGIINFLDAARDPGRGLSKLVKGLAGSVVPSNIAGIAGAIDPDLRDARSILDKIKSRIPAIGPLAPMSSKSLPPRRDIFGEVQKKTGTGISRLISPIEMSPAKDSALEKELSRLKIFPSMPDRKIKGRELSTAQYDRYVSESGKLMKAWIADVIDDPDYKNLPDEVKDRIVRGRINAARAFARNELFADMISGKEND
jgi:hypothetical protein